jgi:hypothetical protein
MCETYCTLLYVPSLHKCQILQPDDGTIYYGDGHPEGKDFTGIVCWGYSPAKRMRDTWWVELVIPEHSTVVSAINKASEYQEQR